MPKSSNKVDTSAMRDLGRSLKDQGFFEADLVTGLISWANDFVLGKYGYSLSQLQSMTLFDLVPEEFHDELRNSVSDQTRGRLFRFSIRPGKSADGKLVWWYLVRVRADHPVYWYRGEYLNTTGKAGSEYSSMTAAMETANGYNDLYNELADFKGWARENVHRLDGADAEIQEDMRELKEQLHASIKASNRAANAALESRASIESFKRDVSEQMSKQTAEIIKLISNDATQGEQLRKFSEFMDKTTAQAVQTMKTTTETAVQQISAQANKSGDKITRQVTVPIGLIAALVTLIQWMIQHYR